MRAKLDFGEIHIIERDPDVEQYEGSYDVTPDTEAQTLPTAKKWLTEDITVRKIPVSSVDNAAGGLTVTIGNKEMTEMEDVKNG